MSEFHDYLNNDPFAWSFRVSTLSTGWHFCFPRTHTSPPLAINAYLLGESGGIFNEQLIVRNRPSTEEFAVPDEVGFTVYQQQTTNPINDIVDAASCTATSISGTRFGNVAILCTSAGHLYVCGDDRRGFASDCKLFGLGPEDTTDRILSDVELSARPMGLRTKTSRSRLTRVLGENGDLEQVRFTGVAAHKNCLAAVDSSGGIWFSGDPCRSGFTVASQFPNDSGGLLSWFRKANFTSYEDASGTVTPAQPLTFKKIRAGATTFIALGTDNNLYTWGNFNLGKEITSTRPHRVNGFLTGVTLNNGGSNYTSTPTVTVSAPQHPNGTRAVVNIINIVNRRITSLSLSNPGWGYTSAPTITFSGGGGSGASATATLFSDTWRDCDAGYNNDYPRTCAAISSGGRLYVTGDRWLYNGSSWASPSSSTLFTSVSLGSDHGVLSRSNGSFGFWGINFYVKPDGSFSTPLTIFSSSGASYVSAQAFGTGYAVLTSDGRIYTAGGNAGAGRGNELYDGLFFVPLNTSSANGVSRARFSAIFGTRFVTFLNRIESRDEFGNLLNPLPPGLPS